jgi:16S rRNA (cytosine1402-N4)-methyltransferase
VTLHQPVMLKEVLAAMQPRDGEIYVDATFGAGGYTRALLESAQCKVFAIDRDPSVQELAEKLQKEFAGRFCFLMGCFSDMVALLAAQGVEKVQGVVMDIGVSSMQIDQAERGFSFRHTGPLDMRQSQSGISAADVVNTMKESELANILYEFGEEKKSRQIARAIVAQRAIKPFETTTELAELIAKVVRVGKQEIHPATRSFQALRIYVNRELEELENALNAAENLLETGGRLVVVSFHSLEDRIVKQYLRQRSGSESSGSRHLPEMPAKVQPIFSIHGNKAIAPTDAEMRVNPRARSAKLRCALRLSQKEAA